MFNRTALLLTALIAAAPLAAATDGAIRIAKAGGSIEINDAPHGAKLATGGGGVRIDNAGAPVSITTGGGSIRIGHAGDAVKAATGGGDIRIDSAAGPVEAVTGSGDIVIALKGSRDVTVTTGNGTVEVRVPRNLSASFDVETSYGRGNRPTHITSDFPLSVHESSDFERRGWNSPRKYVTGTGRAGTGAATIRIRAAQGDIRIVKA